jgi:hypothetical protein
MQTRWPAPNCEGVLVSKRIEQQERLYGLAGGSLRRPSCQKQEWFWEIERNKTHSKQPGLHPPALFVIAI